jgi:hypothetical protein
LGSWRESRFEHTEPSPGLFGTGLLRRRELRVHPETICIDCDECSLQGTEACDDCLVSFVLGRDPNDAIVIDATEARALRLLSGAGLVPGLRHSDAGRAWEAV